MATMTFKVTYRGADGALRAERMEASGRGECVAECRRRGVAPVAIAEGPKGRAVARDERPCQAAAAGRPPYRVAVVAAVVLAVAGGAWWWMAGAQDGRREKPQVETHETGGPVETDVAEVTNGAKVVAGTGSSNGRGVAVAAGLADVPQSRVQTSADIMNLDGEAKTPEQRLYRKRLAAISNRVFKTASDQVLAMAVSGGSAAMPPIPAGTISNEEFRKSLATPITVSDDDPQSVKELKEAVIEARSEMSRMLAKGYTVSEVIAEHQKLKDENREIRAKAEKELREIAASGDVESARRYANSVNAALQQMGIEPIGIPADGGKGRKRRPAADAGRRNDMGHVKGDDK